MLSLITHIKNIAKVNNIQAIYIKSKHFVYFIVF